MFPMSPLLSTPRLLLHLRGERRVGPQHLQARYASIRREDFEVGVA
jgi:hypothetical protein